jgi:hypothetical protein
MKCDLYKSKVGQKIQTPVGLTFFNLPELGKSTMFWKINQ